MAASFTTRTVPAPDTSVVGIDLGPGEYAMIPLGVGVQNGSLPLGWNELFIGAQHSLKGGPSTGNITLLSTEGIEMGMCVGTTYAPTHSSFWGFGFKCVGATWTGNTGGGASNIYFTKNPWATFYRSGGTDTAGGNSSPMYIARDETSANYPNLMVWQFRHYTTAHWLLSAWPMFGVEAWIPKATRKMMHLTPYWSPRDHVNGYFNLELGIGVRCNNPTTANLYPTDAAVAPCDTIWFRNFMPSGYTWRLFYPTVFRGHNESAGT